MKNEINDYLKKSKPNEFRGIMNEDSPLSERLTTTFLRALQEDCFIHYKPRYLPSEADGFFSDYQRYKSTSDEISIKSASWKALQQKYMGYFRALEETRVENSSDLYFLNQMRDHFKALNMRPQEDKCQQRINEFAAAGVSK